MRIAASNRAWKTRRNSSAAKNRLDQQENELKKTGRTLPLVYRILQRFTQVPFKLIRWLRVHWHRPTSLAQALLQLRSLYGRR